MENKIDKEKKVMNGKDEAIEMKRKETTAENYWMHTTTTHDLPNLSTFLELHSHFGGIWISTFFPLPFLGMWGVFG